MLRRNNKPTFQFVVSGASAALIALAVMQSAAASAPSGLSPPPLRYVDDDAPPGGDGLTWPTAYAHLQDALAEAAQPGSLVTELRVGQGMYKPDQGAGQTPGDRSASFPLLNGVAVCGGYAGFGAPDPDKRDVELYASVLSGDLAGDDEPNFVNRDENSYHVAMAVSVDQTAVLDGVTITAGNADGSGGQAFGGGLLTFDGGPTLLVCIFQGNRASFGGAMHNQQSDPTVIDGRFTGNMARTGGAVRNAGSAMQYPRTAPVFIRCTFSENTATDTAGHQGWGGAMRNDYSDPIIVNCSFLSNVASGGDAPSTGEGGAVYGVSSSPTYLNCLFAGNTALLQGAPVPSRGGALYSGIDPYTFGGSEPRILNCTFVDNSACEGGVLYNANAETRATVLNSVLWANGATSIFDDDEAITTVRFCDIQGGWTGAGGDNIDADPLFVNAPGGVYELAPGSPCIDAGWNNAVPPDWLDLDGDEDRSEFTPLDLHGLPRFVDDPAAPDAGCGSPSLTDMGAFEFQAGIVLQPVPGDLDGDQLVGAADLVLLLDAWSAGGGCLADLNADGAVNVVDLLILLALWS